MLVSEHLVFSFGFTFKTELKLNSKSFCTLKWPIWVYPRTKQLWCTSGLDCLICKCMLSYCLTVSAISSLLRRMQAQTLPDAASPIGKVHTFSKIAVTLEPVMRF